MTTLFFLMTRRQDVSRERFVEMLTDEFVPLYVQSKEVFGFERVRVALQPNDVCAVAQSATQKCAAGPFDAVFMLEYADRERYIHAMGTPAALKRLDEMAAVKRRFLDLSRCTLMVTEEIPLPDQSKAQLRTEAS